MEEELCLICFHLSSKAVRLSYSISSNYSSLLSFSKRMCACLPCILLGTVNIFHVKAYQPVLAENKNNLGKDAVGFI